MHYLRELVLKKSSYSLALYKNIFDFLYDYITSISFVNMFISMGSLFLLIEYLFANSDIFMISFVIGSKFLISLTLVLFFIRKYPSSPNKSVVLRSFNKLKSFVYSYGDNGNHFMNAKILSRGHSSISITFSLSST